MQSVVTLLFRLRGNNNTGPRQGVALYIRFSTTFDRKARSNFLLRNPTNPRIELPPPLRLRAAPLPKSEEYNHWVTSLFGGALERGGNRWPR
jgi:hypothetical protein